MRRDCRVRAPTRRRDRGDRRTSGRDAPRRRPSSRASIRAATWCRRTCCGCTSSSRRRWDARAASSTSRCSTMRARRFPAPCCRSTTSSGARTTRASPCSSIPGRVKKGILPNQQMGRPLEVGRSVTLVISREWRDEHGLPLKEEFRRALRVGPADEQPLDTARVAHPAAGGRRPRRRRRHVSRAARPRSADARARRDPRRQAGGRRHRGRSGGDAVDVHAERPVARRHLPVCSRSTSSRTWPAIRSAARSRWTTSTRSTRARTRRRSPSLSACSNRLTRFPPIWHLPP